MKFLALGLVAAMVACGSARADPTVDVGGWTAPLKPDEGGSCAALRGYVDHDDDDKKNAVVFSIFKSKSGSTSFILSLSYQSWDYKKGENETADLLVDGTRVAKALSWQGKEHSLTIYKENGDDLIGAVAAGKSLVLKFGSGGTANFQIPKAGMALGALMLCLSEK